MSRNGSDESASLEGVVWLSTEETLKRTGLSRQTLYRRVNEGKLPAYRQSRSFRFKAHEVDQFVEGTRVQPGDLDDLLRRGWPKKPDK